MAGVAAAAVAQEQHAAGLRKGGAAMRLPPIIDAVASEPTGVVTETQIQVPKVAFDIVETVRIDHSQRGTGKVVVESLLGDAGVKSANAKQKAQKFLVFGVDTDDGIGRIHEFVAIASN